MRTTTTQPTAAAITTTKTFTVHRPLWYRGHGNKQSRLLRPQDGQMCCLGFYSLACGLRPEQIEDKSFPSAIYADIPAEMNWLQTAATPAEIDIADADDWERIIGSANDDHGPTDADREAHIAKCFAAQGIAVVFTDELPYEPQQ